MGTARRPMKCGPGPLRSFVITLLLVFALAGGGCLARPLTVRADTEIGPWSQPSAIADELNDAARPTLAYTSDGTAHALWESGSTIYYAARKSGGTWSAAQRVAAGLSPALAVDTDDNLHAVFANQFLGNYEIFHVTYRHGMWSLPINVSHTYGVSVSPVLAAGPEGALHAAWMDNSPGYWTIFTGSWYGGFWSSSAVPHARGQSPAIAVSPRGVIFVAWQDRVPSADTPNGVFDIYSSQRIGSNWTLAVNVSDNAETDSIGAHLTMTPNGLGQLTWVDGGQNVRYAYGEGYYWPEPQTVVQAGVVARGPHIVAASDTRLYIGWDEGDMVRVTSTNGQGWGKPAVIPTNAGTLKDVTLTLTPTGGVMVGWVQVLRPDHSVVWESRQETDWPARMWLPGVVYR